MIKYVASLLVWPLLLASCLKETISHDIKDEEQIILDSIAPSTARIGDTVRLFGKNLLFGLEDVAVTIDNDSTELVDKTAETIRFVVRRKFSTASVKLHVNGRIDGGFPINYRYLAVVTTIAGTGAAGHTDGAGAVASFKCPWGLALDNNHHLFVADAYNRLIRTVDLGHPDYPVSAISPGNLNFFSPYNIAVDTANGALFVTDFNAHILKIDASGTPSVIYTSPELKTSAGIAVGPDGNVYVSDNVSHLIFRISQDGSNRNHVAQVFLPRNLLFDKEGQLYTMTSHVVKVAEDGSLTHFEQQEPFQGWEFVVDKNGDFYQADHVNNRIQKVERETGKVTVIAGSGARADRDGVGTAASFNGPMSIVIDASGDLYVSTYNFDTGGGNRIRKITFQ